MEEGLRTASDPTIEILFLFPGVGRLVKIAAVSCFYPNHLARSFLSTGLSLLIGPTPTTPRSPRLNELVARSIEDVFHLHRCPCSTTRRRDPTIVEHLCDGAQ
jgi:hypothetical protein